MLCSGGLEDYSTGARALQLVQADRHSERVLCNSFAADFHPIGFGCRTAAILRTLEEELRSRLPYELFL